MKIVKPNTGELFKSSLSFYSASIQRCFLTIAKKTSENQNQILALKNLIFTGY